MSNTLTLTAPEGVPFCDYSREFDFPAAEVFRAHADPELFARWIGPRGLNTRIEALDCRTGGSYRFVQQGDDGVEHAFRGVFHTVRENRFVLQTFEYEGFPDIVTLEYSTFEDLPGGRSRLTGRSLYPSLEARDGYLSSGMESGMAAGYDQLEELLAPPAAGTAAGT